MICTFRWQVQDLLGGWRVLKFVLYRTCFWDIVPINIYIFIKGIVTYLYAKCQSVQSVLAKFKWIILSKLLIFSPKLVLYVEIIRLPLAALWIYFLLFKFQIRMVNFQNLEFIIEIVMSANLQNKYLEIIAKNSPANDLCTTYFCHQPRTLT